MPALLSILLGLGRTLRNRREVVRLTELDDHLLSDIGLRRTDIYAALAQPLSRNLSRMLKAACCQERPVMGRLRSAFTPQPLPCC